MNTRRLRTSQEIEADWLRRGDTKAAWARRNNFNPVTVGQVLAGKNKGSRGVGHVIAVKLGLKDGEIVEEVGHEDA